MKSLILSVAAMLVLLGLSACGGGSSSVGSGSSSGTKVLSYQNPTQSTEEFALVQDSATTSTTLVLDLVGPVSSTAIPACGVAFGFALNDTTQAAWATGPALTNGKVFTLSTNLVEGWVKGASIQGIVANKGIASPAADISKTAGVLATIKLTPVQGGASGTVPLADSGLGTYTDSTGSANGFSIAVGTLSLN
jgi:hypothetical protein